MRPAGRSTAIAALSLLAACAAPPLLPPPAAPGSVVPHFVEGAFVADDGSSLPLRVWRPEGEATAAILALHGFNDYSNAFAAPAEDWAKQGIATYAYDQRGFGEAPDRGGWAGARRLALDAEEACALLRATYPGRPVILLGESMGGAVAIVAATGTEGTPPPAADALVVAAPAVWGRSTMTVAERAALWLADGVVPGMTVTGQGLRIKPSDNTEMLRALSRDPLVIKETRIATIKGLVDLMDHAAAAAPQLHAPMLFLYGDRDEVIPKDPTRRFLAELPPDEQRRVAFYPRGYHMLLRDLDAAVVRGDVAAWLANRKAPLPSGADAHAQETLAATR